MSRRGLIFTVAVIGAMAIALLMMRSKTENVSAPLSESVQPQDMVAEKATPTPTPSKSPSSVSETTSSSSDPGFLVLRGRGAPRMDRPLGGAKKYDASHAQVYNDPAFASTSWKVWSGVTAYPKGHGEPNGTRLGEVNGYYLVDEGDKKSSETFDPSRPMVVLNQRTGEAGVVTGTFTVVLEPGASADFLTKSSEVKVLASFPNTQTYFVTSTQVPFSLKAFKEALQDAPEVKDVQMEILDRQYEKF